ncbi:MAG: hypothetical protein GTN81_16715 [Proteobacteria bacterium]|nr:hypothetical protein [Pseudomonadota bacterium]
MQRKRSLSVEETVDRIIESVSATGTETLPLVQGLNRNLADDVLAPMDLPPFSYATVDGFAISCQNEGRVPIPKGSLFRVIETIPAGSVATQRVRPGMAIRVMTGAPIPPGTDAVVKEEDTSFPKTPTPQIEIKKPIIPMENVASTGEYVCRGDLVLKKGTTLSPRSIGMLASLGIREVEVFRQPAVAVLSTGSELLGLEEPLVPGKIFASSLYFLLAKLQESGCAPFSLGVVGDEAAYIRKQIRSGLAADAIITIGGTRHGDSDWVRQVYRQMRIQTRVDGVAMSPGKSFVFGLLKGKPVFSLPGSPTACIVAFEELVRPALLKMSGKGGRQDPSSPTMKMILEGTIRTKKGLRKFVLAKVVLRDGRLKAIPINRQHRGSLMPTVQANGVIVVPESSTAVGKGEEVNVRLIDLDL